MPALAACGFLEKYDHLFQFHRGVLVWAFSQGEALQTAIRELEIDEVDDVRKFEFSELPDPPVSDISIWKTRPEVLRLFGFHE